MVVVVVLGLPDGGQSSSRGQRDSERASERRGENRGEGGEREEMGEEDSKEGDSEGIREGDGEGLRGRGRGSERGRARNVKVRDGRMLVVVLYCSTVRSKAVRGRLMECLRPVYGPTVQYIRLAIYDTVQRRII